MNLRKSTLVACTVASLIACGEKQQSTERLPDLPSKPDAWVSEVKLSQDTATRFVGKTRDYVIFSTSQVKGLSSPGAIRLGDEIEGLKIGAIRCTFHWQDARGGGEQYMWRGRWGCMAGRSEKEIVDAVRPDGSKQFDYIYIAPVSLPSQ